MFCHLVGKIILNVIATSVVVIGYVGYGDVLASVYQLVLLVFLLSGE